jgi:hypothetical protein
MDCRVAGAVAVLLFLCHAARAQTVSRAYVGEDGKAHVAYGNGDAKTIPPEQKQVGCEHITIAADGHTVGWSVLVENCCTSYPIPVAIVVYRAGKKAVISPGQMVWRWHFVGRGERVAVLFGPVHGRATAASLYDSRSGKALASWHGKGAAPAWAQGWEQEFER